MLLQFDYLILEELLDHFDNICFFTCFDLLAGGELFDLRGLSLFQLGFFD